ncbi:nucleotidyl transferase AbiEii/AbiGii toxin family protein [Yinghuangia sp. YIM S09857]|uniref:nucleotidyl transferase AbiEii/AbiGii toxin family protein n=1 Tax=Yinghuangia sp. YIM S09857 TaxID=3436929 RepID=UPI003F5310F7
MTGRGVAGSGVWERAHRAALDHVLAVVSRAPWSDALVLRGSMAMVAWAGDRARPPRDLDWIVLPPAAVPVDRLDPHPYVDGVDAVQDWPEASGGAAGYELYRDEGELLDTGGVNAVVPPEGTHWVEDPFDDERDPSGAVLELLEREAVAPCGVRLAPGRYSVDSTWEYGAYDFGPTGGGGVRIRFPWEADGGLEGQVQLDFALDEPMAEPPVFALVPRADDLSPTVVRTASRELSLAWKLLWLHVDSESENGACGKDLFDAVLLAELPDTRLEPPLLRRVFARAAVPVAGPPSDHDVRNWHIDWRSFRGEYPRVHGDADAWQARLARAIAPVLDELAEASS